MYSLEIGTQLTIIADRIQTFGSKARRPQERSATVAAISNDLYLLESKGAQPDVCERLRMAIPKADAASALLQEIEGVRLYAHARK